MLQFECLLSRVGFETVETEPSKIEQTPAAQIGKHPPARSWCGQEALANAQHMMDATAVQRAMNAVRRRRRRVV